MASTTNITVTESEGWRLISTDPKAVTLKSNSPSWYWFHVAIAGSEPSGDFVGELHGGGTSWESQGFIGNLFVKVDIPNQDHHFAVTI